MSSCSAAPKDCSIAAVNASARCGDIELGADAAVARAIAILARREPSMLAIATDTILQLAEKHPGALAGTVALDGMSDEHAARATAIAERALLPAARANHPNVLWMVAPWLESSVARERGTRFVDGLTKLLLADSPDTRIAALDGLKGFLSRNGQSGFHTERSAAWQLISQLAEHDPDWRMRARAMLATSDLAASGEDQARVAKLSALGLESRVAIERRVAGVLKLRLAKVSPAATP